MLAIGVDIGATKISFVLMKNWRLIKRRKILTPKDRGVLIKTLKENIERLIADLPKSKILGIGIGIPGPLSKKGDLILNPPNLTCLKNFPLAKIIEKELRIKTKMANDVNCFTIAEATIGAGKGAGVVFGITLGTGVGGGIVINGKIYQGAFSSAGEIGHATINFDGPKCTCGSYGGLEEYCSERFIKREAGVSPKELEKKARNGNKKAINIFEKLGYFLGIGVSNIIDILSPEIVVIGGGIAKAGKFFLKSVRKSAQSWSISPVSKKYVTIKKAKLGDFAGAIGAALLLKS